MIDDNFYCSMIHGGLHLDFKKQKTEIQHCCLRNDLTSISDEQDIWNDDSFQKLRILNKQNQLPESCLKICKSLENSGYESMRTGMNQGLKISPKTDVSGPARIDLKFDLSCNLACRTCGPDSSTFWQKHLNKNLDWPYPIFSPNSKYDVIKRLEQLDLSNLRMLVFCGGETLLGHDYWDVAEWLSKNVPMVKENLTICFQTNGTQPILEKYFPLIDKFHLVKLHFSIDAIGDQFEYLRWPAKWQQVVENVYDLKNNLPSNVMFLVETTLSVFNLYYANSIDTWIKNNLSTNREGDPIVHSKHLARGIYSTACLSKEYVEHLYKLGKNNLVPNSWKENPEDIKKMIKLIKLEDLRRNQNWEITFSEVSKFYSRFNDK